MSIIVDLRQCLAQCQSQGMHTTFEGSSSIRRFPNQSLAQSIIECVKCSPTVRVPLVDPASFLNEFGQLSSNLWKSLDKALEVLQKSYKSAHYGQILRLVPFSEYLLSILTGADAIDAKFLA